MSISEIEKDFINKVCRAKEDNPELPVKFIADSLLARSEIDEGLGTPYVRGSEVTS